jgi:hypothetical protein
MRTYRSSHRRRPSRRSTIDHFQSIRLEGGGINRFKLQYNSLGR